MANDIELPRRSQGVRNRFLTEHRRQLRDALWGSVPAPDGLPCQVQPLFRAVCGSASVGQIRAHLTGCGECPFGYAPDCPGARLRTTPLY